MTRTRKAPAEATTSLPGLENRLRGQIQNSKPAPINEGPVSPWQVRVLARRFGLTLPTAETVAALAGLGGTA